MEEKAAVVLFFGGGMVLYKIYPKRFNQTGKRYQEDTEAQQRWVGISVFFLVTAAVGAKRQWHGFAERERESYCAFKRRALELGMGNV